MISFKTIFIGYTVFLFRTSNMEEDINLTDYHYSWPSNNKYVACFMHPAFLFVLVYIHCLFYCNTSFDRPPKVFRNLLKVKIIKSSFTLQFSISSKCGSIVEKVLYFAHLDLLLSTHLFTITKKWLGSLISLKKRSGHVFHET